MKSNKRNLTQGDTDHLSEGWIGARRRCESIRGALEARLNSTAQLTAILLPGFKLSLTNLLLKSHPYDEIRVLEARLLSV